LNFHLLPFTFFVSKFGGWRGRHFYGRHQAALGLATPLVQQQIPKYIDL